MKRRSLLIATLLGLSGCQSIQTDSPETETPERDRTEFGHPSNGTITAGVTTTQTETVTTTEDRGHQVTRPETETETATTTETTTETTTQPTPTTTPPPEPAALKISETELINSLAMFGPDGYAQIDIENPTGNHHGYVEAHASFLNSDGDVIDEELENVEAVPSGETWRIHLGYRHGDNSKVKACEIRLADQSPRLPIRTPDGATITDRGTVKPAYNGYEVTGTIKVAQALDYLEVLAFLYDADGYFRGVGYANESDIEANTTWNFTADETLNAPDFATGMTDHELLLNAT